MCVYMYVVKCVFFKNNLISFLCSLFFLSKGLMTQKKASLHFEDLELNQTNTKKKKKRSRIALFVLFCIQTKI